MFSSMRNTIITRATLKKDKRLELARLAIIRPSTFGIHEAIATASRYSVSVLAYAADFLYHQGQKERVFDLGHVIRRIIGIDNILSDVGEQITLLRLSSGVLILLVNQANSNESILVAIDLQSHPGQVRRRRLLLQEPVSSDPIFVRHTGFYICLPFITRLATPRTVESRRAADGFWRRDHREGPIHEMWADLFIQVDERKGRPAILECRREWLDGGSENHHTYYTTPLPTPDEALAMHSSEGLTHQGGLVDSDDEHSQSSEKRLARDCHAEHETSDPLDQRFDFILAYTRHSSYHLAAATYIELVNDPKSQADGVHSQHCLRLRTKSPNRNRFDERGVGRYGSLLSDPGQSQVDGRPEGGSESRFQARGVCLWPPVNAPSRLLDLLCPDKSTSLVRAVCDERSLIYSTSAEELPLHHRMLVLISFDPMIRLPYLTSLCNHKASTNSIRKVLDAPRPGFQFSRPLVHNADAFHLAIRQGYRP
ncbi:unnamed protein product [Penicillium salamii]|nr:unnamed protein product [Penicillium salamii]CAG8312583.1 unnamed protein product [Penicillium salamii]CAG8328302.1 unnamed protein product [Penicillium salamii]CAG8425398.1 unnamed protein product [Penicillium salamii]CAG8430574.1 unnamed protein product [Penicillium salamii]